MSSRSRQGSVRVRGEPVLVPRSEYHRLGKLNGRAYVDAIEFMNWSIGQDLIRLRRAARLTQAEAARRAGVRPETLSRLENGRGNPTVRTMERIVRALERAKRERAKAGKQEAGSGMRQR